MKKWLIFLIILIIPFFVFAYPVGDVDGNGAVCTNDYLLVRKHILKSPELTGEELQRANVDGQNGPNGESVSTSDYLEIRKIILKKTDSSDCQNVPSVTPSSVSSTPIPTPTNEPTVTITSPSPKPAATISSQPTVAPTQAPTTSQEKTLTATFTVLDSKNITTSSTKETCTIHGNETKCEITAPKLTANSGYTVIGWNTNKSAITSVVNSGGKITISSDVSYYAISKKDNALIATFEIATKATANKQNEKCYRYNGSSSCTVEAPTITPEKGYEVVGWGTDSKKTNISVASGGNLEIKSSTKYYSIVKKKISISFERNTNLRNSDVTKSNIKADKLSFYSTSCYSYNDNGCKITKVPIIYSKGNVTHGFSLTKDGVNIEVERKKFKEDTTLYARVYNSINTKGTNVSFGGYELSGTKTYGNIVVEFEDKITDNEYINYIYYYLDLLYREHPELFYFNGKIIIASSNTYVNSFKSVGKEKVNGTSYHYNGHITIVIHSHNGAPKTCFTITHEMGHAYDREFYQVKNGLIRERTTIKDMFTKYLNETNKPFRPYSFNLKSNEDEEEGTNEDNTKTGEFVADLFAYGTFKDFSLKKITRTGDDGKQYSYMTRPDSTYDKDNYITQELYNMYKSLLKEGNDYFKSIGVIK